MGTNLPFSVRFLVVHAQQLHSELNALAQVFIADKSHLFVLAYQRPNK